MKRIHSISATSWHEGFSAADRQAAIRALEEGQVLYFPSLSLPLSFDESRFLDPAILARSKNVSCDPRTNTLRGTACQGKEAEQLAALLQRFADSSLKLLHRIVPHYCPALLRQRTSLRPAEIKGRPSSWRKDDTRLHVDSFPSQPVQGRRILRLFCNVNPNGQPRTWRVGEPFPTVAKWFWPRLPAPSRLHRQFLSLFHVTKGLRSEYDHYMLQLHDAMKADVGYQQNASQETIDFPPGSSWLCFTDQVSHAAMSGQHLLEQTFSLPVAAMYDRSTSPLAVLEKLAGRPLTAQTERKAA
jgi:hypothetical protein